MPVAWYESAREAPGVQEFATFVASPNRREPQSQSRTAVLHLTPSCHLLWLFLPIGSKEILWTTPLIATFVFSVRNKLAVVSGFTSIWLT